jgi:hypothetical protein
MVGRAGCRFPFLGSLKVLLWMAAVVLVGLETGREWRQARTVLEVIS